MIFAVVEYRKCTIDLFKQNNTHKLVQKCKLAEPIISGGDSKIYVFPTFFIKKHLGNSFTEV